MPVGGSTQRGGPGIRAVDPWLLGNESESRSHQLLSDEERAHLAAIASIIRFKKHEQIYSEGEPAEAIFNVISGVIKVYKTAPDGGEHISAFLYPEDLCGLSEAGRYANSARAVTAVTAYSLPVSAFRRELSKDADLELHVIVKLCHDLREEQRHAFLLTQRHAVAKLAMFAQLQERVQSAAVQPAEIYLPMNRSDIADYVGISPAAVSRAFRDLEAQRIITHRDRRHIRIIDREALEDLACNRATKAPSRRSSDCRGP